MLQRQKKTVYAELRDTEQQPKEVSAAGLDSFLPFCAFSFSPPSSRVLYVG